MTARLLIRLIRTYQRYVSPATSARCKFYPSCSAYAAEAVDLHGARHGAWLTLRRLSKCHPFHRGGVDLVPTPRGSRPTGGDVGVPSGAQR